MKVWKNGTLIEEIDDVVVDLPEEPTEEERLEELRDAMLALLGMK